MPTFHADALTRLATTIFRRTGARDDDARCVAEHLVASNLAGHDSHGVLRIAQYMEMIDAGMLKPDGRMRIENQFAAGAVVVERKWGRESVDSRPLYFSNPQRPTSATNCCFAGIVAAADSTPN